MDFLSLGPLETATFQQGHACLTTDKGHKCLGQVRGGGFLEHGDGVGDRLFKGHFLDDQDLLASLDGASVR